MRFRPVPLLLLVLASAVSGCAARRPRDFESFWGRTRRELAAVPLEPRLEPDPRHSTKETSCFKASFVSLNRALIHARYCRPKREGRYPAVLVSPWYAQDRVDPPLALAKAGVAALSYQGRGYEVDLSTYPLDNYWYILSGIQDPDAYVFRELVSHSLRGLDFLAGRPEVDGRRIAAMGASQGGGLSLMVAGLDKRVVAVAADFPFLSDWELSLYAEKPPYAEVRKYMAEHPDEREGVRKTVSYFDALNVAAWIHVPAFFEVGLQDRTCPPEGVKSVYRRIPDPRKQIREYAEADHTDLNAQRWQAMVDFIVATLNGL